MRDTKNASRTTGLTRRIAAWALRACIATAGALMIGLVAYFGTAWALVLWPANATPVAGPPPTIDAWVVSNGVHVDLVLPATSPMIDWTRVFPPGDFPGAPRNARHVAIGWGERDFYLHTQHFSDLTAGRAMAALSGMNRTLVHVSYLGEPGPGKGAYAIRLSEAQYASLIEYIRQSLVLADTGRAVQIPGQHYGKQDAFYEARGRYSLFETCNTWAGKALLRAGVKVSRWTPLDSMVLWHLPTPVGAGR